MKIQSVTIHNFRSIQHACFVCKDMLVLLGQNNAGKSNVIAALEFALTPSAKPDREDLSAFASPDDEETWVEVVFDRLTDRERATLSEYLLEEGTVRIRKTATYSSDGAVSVVYQGYRREPTHDWLKSRNADALRKGDASARDPLCDYLPKTSRLTSNHIRKAQSQYIEAHRSTLVYCEELEKGLLLGTKRLPIGVLPEFFLVPAVRNLRDESKVKSTTLFGRLLSRVVATTALAEPRFREVQDKLEALSDSLGAGSGSDNRPPLLDGLASLIEEELSEWGNLSLSLEVVPPNLSRVLEGTKIHLDDGFKTSAERKGDGLQRAVIFALLKAWATLVRQSDGHTEATVPRNASESVVFAIEEPETFLHPHKQRVWGSSLRELAKQDNNQVFICSHSTHFVDLKHYRDIGLVRRASANEATTVVQCRKELFEGQDKSDRKKRLHMRHWVNPDRGEMLFARRVAFVEGETEKVVFPYLAEKLGCYREDVSVIDCGSKHNLPLYVSIANAFCLEYVVVHDEDPVPKEIPESWNADKVNAAKRTFAVNQALEALVGKSGRIAVLHPDFEGCSGVPSSGGKGKALAALDHFESVLDHDPPACLSADLASAVRLVYEQPKSVVRETAHGAVCESARSPSS